jgi:hypothetical protein
MPASGGMVRLPAGTFEITKPLRITQEDVRIEGAGTATHIKNVNTEGQAAMILQPAALATNRNARQWRVQLASFRLTGNEKSGHGIIATNVNEIFIDGLEIPAGNVVGEPGSGFYHLLDSLNPERIFTAIEAVGIGRAALDRAVQYAKDRIVFDRPIGQNQAVAHPLAQAWARLEAAEAICWKAAWLYDRGRPCGAEANTAKLVAAEAGFEACDVAVQTLGGYGYAREFYVERLWREVRLYKIAPISQQMVLNYLSEHVLGLPRSY